ncbi:hypothetical protein [Methylobacterium sp. E-045]|uniref:hypothetical protein n=1 Tax=Methylobacterium sp. E-045 TaxID=2836575 RepID=UPI001FBAE4E0|nr:hypothetical protein [Methylobacterium sp. E-045]MCJ2132352.1 hypothetical protein [Methylobacterium sp. E-045]
MNRVTLSVGVVILSLGAASGVEAGGRHDPVHAMHDGPHVHRHGAKLPPQIPYRDRRYRPAPPVMMQPVSGPPVVLGLVPAHNPNAPVYNEPPPRFLHD